MNNIDEMRAKLKQVKRPVSKMPREERNAQSLERIATALEVIAEAVAINNDQTSDAWSRWK